MRLVFLSFLGLATLAACSGGSPSLGARSTGAEVSTDGFETYTTDHNGYTRVRRSYAGAADGAILAQFEDADPSDPAGFRNLVALDEAALGDRVIVEVIGEQTDPGGTVQRLLRLTTDVEAFDNLRNNGELRTASGQFVLQGTDYAWAGSEGRDLAGAQTDHGALYLALDFDTETAAIHITNYNFSYSETGDVIGTDLLAEGIPLNIVTGAFGGELSGTVYYVYGYEPARAEVSGTLLGTLGGSTADGLVAAGIYAVRGDTATVGTISVDGVFTALQTP